MKELELVELKNFDIKVHPYLSYVEIQTVVQTTLQLESWAERQTNIDMLVLAFGTDKSMEELQEIGHETLLRSGLIDAVKANIRNFNCIEEALKYEESTVKAINTIIKFLPKYKKELEKVLKNGHPNKKQ